MLLEEEKIRLKGHFEVCIAPNCTEEIVEKSRFCKKHNKRSTTKEIESLIDIPRDQFVDIMNNLYSEFDKDTYVILRKKSTKCNQLEDL